MTTGTTVLHKKSGTIFSSLSLGSSYRSRRTYRSIRVMIDLDIVLVVSTTE